jgi:hypothetical protein
MIIGEIRNSEVEKRVAKTVQKRQWTNRDDALQKSLTWTDIWHMAPLRLSFIAMSMYDMLSSATNLVKWARVEDD